jgi:hypothetical protein
MLLGPPLLGFLDLLDGFGAESLALASPADSPLWESGSFVALITESFLTH